MSNKVEVATVKPEVSFLNGEESFRIIEFLEESILDSKIESITNFLKETNGFGKTDEQKDVDYAHAQSLWREYQKQLRSVGFNFYLDRPQYTLLSDILLKKLEYDVNNIFIAIELTDLLGNMSGTKYSDDKEIKPFKVTATDITYIYHLIQNFKVKGLTKEAYTFSKILRKIGEISKLVNYYDAHAKNLTEEISKWALSLDGNEQLLYEIPEKES